MIKYHHTDYSLVFDAEYYLNKYKKLRNTCPDHRAALKHFIEIGMDRGLRGNEVFDPVFYRKNNSDLRCAYKRNWKQYYHHYLRYGKREGRLASAKEVIPVNDLDYSRVFDAEYYLNRYNKLRRVCPDREAALKHFLEKGMTQGMRGCCLFDPKIYRKNYWDLNVAFGRNWPQYYLHYIQYGSREARRGDVILCPNDIHMLMRRMNTCRILVIRYGWVAFMKAITNKLRHRNLLTGLKLKNPDAVVDQLRFPQLHRSIMRRPAFRMLLEEQKSVIFPQQIKISVLVPLYNTPKKMLREMIESVQHQTYSNWELCLADGSDGEHSSVEMICLQYAGKDSRIQYKKLERNLGISGNTNACIEMATGDYLALFDHDDLLHPSALYENMKAICEKGADFIYTDEATFHDTPENMSNIHLKPDFAPDNLRANNYICHFTVFKRSLLEKAGGGFRSEFDGSQDFDMILRLTEQAEKIVHIPMILYFWRAHKGSVAENIGAKPYVLEAAKNAIAAHLKRVRLEGEVLDSPAISMYRIRYKIQREPLISIIIPNMDHVDDLKRCLDSIYTKSTWRNFEIIIIENNSKRSGTFAFYKKLQKCCDRLKIVTWKGKFNYSAINNFGFRYAQGEYVLLLNNDTEVIAPDWMQEMLMYAQREDVGAVGAKLYYPDHTIQHAGVGIGLLSLAAHYHRYVDGNNLGYMGRLIYAQNVSAVTAACMMLPRRVYEEVNGLDETFEVAFNDVDLCMRIRENGHKIIFTPHAELYHYESKSRGSDDTPEKHQRFLSEVDCFHKRWGKQIKEGDPYFNPGFSQDREDFVIVTKYAYEAELRPSNYWKQ